MATTTTLEGPIIQLASSKTRGTGLYLTYIIENQDRTAGTTTIKYSLYDHPFKVNDMGYFIESTGLKVGDQIYVGINDNLPSAISYWYTNPVTENTFRTQIDPYLHDIKAFVTDITNNGTTAECRRWLLEDVTLIVNSLESYDLNINVTGWFGMNVNTNVTIGLADYGIITMAPTAFTDEASPTVQYINPRGSAVTVLQVGLFREDTNQALAAYRNVDKSTSGSYTFTFTDAERAAFYSFLSTTTNGRVYFALRTTYNGTTNVSSSYATLSLMGYSPLISPVVKDTNATTVALTGNDNKFIKYYSQARFEMNATARKGASIASYATTHNGATYRGATGVVNNIETTRFVFSATDTRSIAVSQTVDVPMIEYTKLTCNISSAEAPTTDDKIALSVSGNFWNQSFGAVKNTLTLYYRWKTNTNDTYTIWEFLSGSSAPSSGNSYSASFEIPVPNHVDRYTLQIKAVDKLSTVESKTVTVQAYPIFDWDANDFNFNVPVAMQSSLSVAGSANVMGNLNIGGSPVGDFIVEQGTKTTGSGNSQANWVYRKWNSGIAECWCRKHVSTAVNTAWGNLYVSGALSYTNITWGVSFTDIPVANITIAPNATGAFLIAGGSTSLTKTNTGGYEIARGSALTTAGNFYINYYAIGTWK